MSCKKIRRYFSSYLDGELHSKMKQIVEEHLSRCKQCSAEFEKLKNIVQSSDETFVSTAQQVKPPPELHSNIMTAVTMGEKGLYAQKDISVFRLKYALITVILMVIASLATLAVESAFFSRAHLSETIAHQKKELDAARIKVAEMTTTIKRMQKEQDKLRAVLRSRDYEEREPLWPPEKKKIGLVMTTIQFGEIYPQLSWVLSEEGNFSEKESEGI